MSNPQSFRLLDLKTWDLSLGRVSWLLPVVFAAIYLLIFFATWPMLFDDLFTPIAFVFLCGLCLLFALLGLRGRHKISAVVGFVLNGLVVVGALWLVSNLSFAVKF